MSVLPTIYLKLLADVSPSAPKKVREIFDQSARVDVPCRNALRVPLPPSREGGGGALRGAEAAQMPDPGTICVVASFALFEMAVGVIISFLVRQSDEQRLGQEREDEAKLSDAIKQLDERCYGDERCSAADECSICPGRYEADDKVRRLKCGHEYHSECIEQWARCKGLDAACPLCTRPLFPPRTCAPPIVSSQSAPAITML